MKKLNPKIKDSSACVADIQPKDDVEELVQSLGIRGVKTASVRTGDSI